MLQPFQWGQGGQKLTPGQVKIMRELAAAKANRQTPTNLGEGLASVGDALLYNTNMARASEAESAGIEQVQQALAEARASGSSDAFLDVMGNEWATPGQQLIAGELYKRSIPDWQTSENGGDILRWNANDPESSPELWYDGPDELAAADIKKGLNPIWGQFEDGTFGYGVQGEDGRFYPVDTGDFQPMDPRTLNTERAAGTTIGRGTGERELQAPMAEAAMTQINANTDNVIATIDEAIGMAGAGETGLVGAIMGGVQGTKAFDLREKAKTIKANLGFAELQAMRDASPTGGALGQVAVQELEALQSTLASINPDQSEDQLKANLARVKELLERQKQFRQMALEAKFTTTPAAGGSTGGGYTVLGVE